MSISELYIIILKIFIFSSIILGIFLIVHPKKLFIFRTFGIILLSWSYVAFATEVNSKQLLIDYPHLYGVAYVVIILYFPLLYIFLKSYLFKKERSLSRNFVHLLPALLYAMSMLSLFFQGAETKSNIILDPKNHWTRGVFEFTYAIVIFMGVIYSVLAYKLIIKYEGNLSHKSEKIDNVFQWMKESIIMNAII